MYLVLAAIGWVSSAEPGLASGTVESFSLSTATGVPGSMTTVSGAGFGASEVVNVKFDKTARGSATTNMSGAFSKAIKVPPTGAGVHTVAVTGTTSATRATLTFVVPAPDSITVTPANPTIHSGSEQFSATGAWGASTANITNFVTWASSAKTIAMVSDQKGSKGLATALDEGAAVISATTGGVTGSTTLTIDCGRRSNGLGQTFFDCSPVGTHTLLTATEAATAWLSGTGAGMSFGVVCGSGANTGQAVEAQNATGYAVWAYSGPTAGHVFFSPSEASCPSTADPAWL